MALKREGGTDKARRIVESVIRDHGAEPDENKVSAAEGGFAWALAFGSAALMIAINPGRFGETGRIRIVSPLVRIEGEPKADLLLRLLELNGTALPGVAFGMVENEIVLVVERSVRGIDRAGVEEMIAMIGHFGDEYDDVLVNEFGGIRVCDLD